MKIIGLVLALFAATALAEVPDISKSFESDINAGGQNFFVKFYAPWCGHCKRLKPDWDKLGETFQDSSSVTIADVDCTSDAGKEVCNANGVRGYPTLKYFTPDTGIDGMKYEGPRSLDALESFVKDTLELRCTLEDRSHCDDQEMSYIKKMEAKDAEAIQNEVVRLEALLKSAKMASDKKKWMSRRLAILKQF